MNLLALLLVGAALAGQPHWSYSGAAGPAHWTGACAQGKRQSPVNVPRDGGIGPTPLHFSYRPSPVALEDNGHTWETAYSSGSFLEAEGRRYELLRFHFHHPAENLLAGKRFPMEIHLVHKDETGRLAVVAVMIKEGRANPTIGALWSHARRIDAGALLPVVSGYYSFDGSLTTPPCAEGVAWFVLKEPIEASPGQIEHFARAYPDNARLVQPLNERQIRQGP